MFISSSAVWVWSYAPCTLYLTLCNLGRKNCTPCFALSVCLCLPWCSTFLYLSFPPVWVPPYVNLSADIFVSSTRLEKVLTSCKINLVDVKWYFCTFCQVYVADFFQLVESCDTDTSQGIQNGFKPSWIILICCWDQIIIVICLVRMW